MTIDINNLINPNLHGASESKAASNTDNDLDRLQNEAARPSTSDTMSLSDMAKHMGKISESLIQTPVVDTQRVAQIKQAIQEGNYAISPEKIADKFMLMDTTLNSKV